MHYDCLGFGCPPAVVMQDADYNIVDTELVAFFTTTTNLTNGMNASRLRMVRMQMQYAQSQATRRNVAQGPRTGRPPFT
jgi:hypothetical protein